MTESPIRTVERPTTCTPGSAQHIASSERDHRHRFHGRDLADLDADAEYRPQGARGRHSERASNDRAQVQAAVGRLVQAATPASPRTWAALDRDGPLFAACWLVGEALGLPLQPASPRRPGSGVSPLQAIARASRLHTRRITLRGAWWKRASGPFVAYRLEDGRPVAILPASGGYELHDPVAGTVTPATATVAASLEPHAETIYRPFDRGALTARSLVTFGLRGSGRDLLLLIGLSVALGLLGLLPPIVTGALFDFVIPGGHRALLLQLGAWLVAGALATALLQLTREITVLRLVVRFQATTESAMLGRLLDLPVSFFKKYAAADLTDRLLAVSAVREALAGPALSALLSTLSCAISFALLLVADVRLGLVAAGLVLVLVGMAATTGYLQMRYQQRLAERTGRLASTVLQLIVGVPKLRAAGAESRAFARWADQFAEQRRVAHQARRMLAVVAVIMAAYPLVASTVLFAVVAQSHQSGLSVGAFLAFNAIFSQLIGSVMSVLQASTAICQVVPAYERARPILQAPAEVDAPRVDPGELDGAIEIERVSFRYRQDGPPILHDVSIECRPGELVALVGPSGSGKSTLLRLLLGFEPPEAGAILYDGRDLATLDALALRRQVGTVLQSGRLMSGDIFTNIVGGSTLTMDDAWAAARLAGLEDEIRQLPMQMHTIIGEGSATLSGGQQQRLMIARAIVHRPRILFFDEATSALDNRTQEIVARSLEGLAATRLVVAHRLSTVVNADRIYVLEGGRVVECGAYRDLMARDGRFAALARRQLL